MNLNRPDPSEPMRTNNSVKTTESSSAGIFPAGTLIQNRFEIVSLLGQGGMAVVYKADDKLLKRTIALKVLQKVDDSRLQRFQREAQSAAKLDHPGILKIFDFYFQEEPLCIAMELVEGTTLSEFIAHNADSDTTFILDIFIAVSDALAHAHKEGVVHRDIKPSNIMLVPGTTGLVKVMDFGIAKALDDTAPRNSSLTRTGEMIGSPFYMSPEQVTGKVVDKRSDIYSFGCALYEALTRVPTINWRFGRRNDDEAAERNSLATERSVSG